MGNIPRATVRPEPDLGGERVDRLFEALAHPARRYALWYLDQVGGCTTVSQLAAALETWQASAPTPDRAPRTDDRVAIALRHTHLPKLVSADLVEQRDRTVALLDAANDALVHVHAVAGR